MPGSLEARAACRKAPRTAPAPEALCAPLSALFAARTLASPAGETGIETVFNGALRAHCDGKGPAVVRPRAQKAGKSAQEAGSSRNLRRTARRSSGVRRG